jgi:ATP-dependent Lon protease
MGRIHNDSGALPEGFKELDRLLQGDFDRMGAPKLLVPLVLGDELNQRRTSLDAALSRLRACSVSPQKAEELEALARSAALGAAEEKAVAERLQAHLQEKDEPEERPTKALAAPATCSPHKRHVEATLQALCPQWPETPAQGHIRLLTKSTYEGFCEQLLAGATVDKLLIDRDLAFVKALIANGVDRPLQVGSPQAWQALEAQCPGYEAQIIKTRDALAQGRTPDPLLIVGDPGVGKTHFSMTLADCIGVPQHRVDGASGINGTALAGVARNWANTEVGAVAKLLAQSPAANPLLLVDEVDKGRRRGGADFCPLAEASLQLLEPLTSGRFKDNSVGLELNASRVLWVFTANSLKTIPPAFLSRVDVFEPAAPTIDGLIRRAWSMADALTAEFGLARMPRSVVLDHADTNPRLLARLLRQACLSARAAGRDEVVQADIDAQYGRAQLTTRLH